MISSSSPSGTGSGRHKSRLSASDIGLGSGVSYSSSASRARSPSPSKPPINTITTTSSSSSSSSTSFNPPPFSPSSSSSPSSPASQHHHHSYSTPQQLQLQYFLATSAQAHNSHANSTIPSPSGPTYYAPSPTKPYTKHMHSLRLSVEPMRTVPSPAAASLSPVGGGASAATSGADFSRTHSHSRTNSLAASRKPSMDVEEKLQAQQSRQASPVTPNSSFSHARIPSPLTGPPHFPPSFHHHYNHNHSSHHHYPHHVYAGEAQCPPRSRPPLSELILCAVRERFCSRSSSGALGRGLMIGWVVTTLGFLAATAFWKGELFTALDRLSKNLYDMGYQGLVVFGVLIFITTIPPLPLYSTLIVLSGYTFGVWNGFVASYIASLFGAVVVFIVSRTWLRDAVTRSLASSPTATSLLQIIPQNPHLLLLIRIAPYPYNLLNVVLASAPSLSLQTYTCCTAISLCKLVLHTWIGAGIRDISAAYGGTAPDSTSPSSPSNKASDADDVQHERVKAGVTWGGIILCCVLFVYLTHVAKRAIAKAQDEQRVVREEEIAFLTPMGDARDLDSE